MHAFATHPATLLCFGALVGFIGALLGVGGGFFMVPYFTLLAGMEPGAAAGTSLAVILLGAASGSVWWARRRRIDYAIGIAFGLATIPGLYMGHVAAKALRPEDFKILFAVVVALAAVLLLKSGPDRGAQGRFAGFRKGLKRRFVDANGHTEEYEIDFEAGLAMSVLAGFAAALFGVGGGFIHVPMMILLYGMPAHIAVATSQFVLAITAGAGSAGCLLWVPSAIDTHVWIYAGIGAVIGAQPGALVAARVPERRLRAILGGLLLAVCVSMFASGLHRGH